MLIVHIRLKWMMMAGLRPGTHMRICKLQKIISTVTIPAHKERQIKTLNSFGRVVCDVHR